MGLTQEHEKLVRRGLRRQGASRRPRRVRRAGTADHWRVELAGLEPGLEPAYSTRWMMWMPKVVLTTPTSPTLRRSDRFANGGMRPASGVTS